MGNHARLSPSSAKRWMMCAAAPAREAPFPDSSSEYADWGTAAHAILECALLQDTHPDDVGIDHLVLENDTGESYKLVDRYGLHDQIEMRQVAAVAYEHVLFQGDVVAECPVNPGALIGREDLYGTADIQVLNPGHLEIVDLKAGKGVLVEPDDPQLWLYAAGAYRMHPLRFHSPETDTITMTIVQPRAQHPAGPIRSITVPASHVLTWMEQTVKPLAALTDSPDVAAKPSEDGCRWCRAKATCPELAQAGLAAAQAVFQPVAVGGDRQTLADSLTRNPDQLSGEEVRFILDNEKLITGWLDSVRKYAVETLKSGGAIPGYKMVAGRGNRSWDTEGDNLYKEFKAFTQKSGKKLTKGMMYESKFISPAQAEKNLKGILSAEAWGRIEAHIVKAAGAPTLAAESDSRPAIAMRADQVFKLVEDTGDNWLN